MYTVTEAGKKIAASKPGRSSFSALSSLSQASVSGQINSNNLKIQFTL